MRTAKELSDWQHYLTHGEIDLIQKCVKQIEKPVTVNIGAGAGTSTISVLEANKDAVVFSIDILASGSEITTNEHLRLEECGADYISRTKRIWGDSKIVGINWPVMVDMVFVDGDHSFAGCKGDIEAWLPHIRSGGFILFHDYGSPTWPDVKMAVDMLMAGEVATGLAEKFGHKDTVIAYKLK